MSLACFFTYVQNAAAASPIGVLSKGELTSQLLANGMTQPEIDGALQALSELYKARVRESEGKSMSKEQRALVNAVYKGGVLNTTEAGMLEEIAQVMGVPIITEAEMTRLKNYAHLADEREGSEKALVEEEIRSIIDQKQPEYYGKLNASKISFKVLLSIGFNVMSYMSNKKKVLEAYGIQRVKLAQEGKGFFSPYVLKDYHHYTKDYAKAMSQGVRGITNERGFWQRFMANVGLGGKALLGPTVTYGADLNAHSDALEHPNEREQSKYWGWWRELDRKIARTSKRWLSSIDTNAKVKMGEIFYFNEIEKKLRKEYPLETDAQIMRRVYADMYSIDEDTARAEAEQQFLDWGIVDSNGEVNTKSNRFKVRVAEIMRRGRDPEIMRQAYEKAASKVWQNRMTYPSRKNDPYDLTKFQQRLDSGLGGIIADGLQGLKQTANNVLGGSMVGQGLVFSLFGFINGAAAYWQDFMEHNFVYGSGKLGRLMLMRKNDDLTQEQRDYLEEKITETKGKVLFGLTETAIITALGFMVRQMCKDAGHGNYSDFVTPDKPMGGQAAASVNVEQQRPESSLNFCGKFSIPLEFTGGFSISNMKFIASLADQMENKDENFISSVLHAAWLTSNPAISPLMDQNPGAIPKIWDTFQKATKEGKGYDNFYNTSSRELAMSVSNMFVRLLPIPQRVIREGVQTVVPYKSFAPAGIQGNPKETLLNFLWQTSVQAVYSAGNLTGVNQIISLASTTDGKIGKPVFDYRHRPIDMGNLYDGKSVAGLTKPLRDLIKTAEGKTPILYDEVDHFLAINDVSIPFDSRVYTRLYKDDPEQTRQLTDHEYYSYQYAYTKKFGEWIEGNYENLKNQEPADVRSEVTRRLGEMKRDALDALEADNKLDGEEIYSRIN